MVSCTNRELPEMGPESNLVMPAVVRPHWPLIYLALVLVFCHALHPPVLPVGPDPQLWGHILLLRLTPVIPLCRLFFFGTVHPRVTPGVLGIPLCRLFWADTMGFDRGYH